MGSGVSVMDRTATASWCTSVGLLEGTYGVAKVGRGKHSTPCPVSSRLPHYGEPDELGHGLGTDVSRLVLLKWGWHGGSPGSILVPAAGGKPVEVGPGKALTESAARGHAFAIDGRRTRSLRGGRPGAGAASGRRPGPGGGQVLPRQRRPARAEAPRRAGRVATAGPGGWRRPAEPGPGRAPRAGRWSRGPRRRSVRLWRQPAR